MKLLVARRRRPGRARVVPARMAGRDMLSPASIAPGSTLPSVRGVRRDGAARPDLVSMPPPTRRSTRPRASPRRPGPETARPGEPGRRLRRGRHPADPHLHRLRVRRQKSGPYREDDPVGRSASTGGARRPATAPCARRCGARDPAHRLGLQRARPQFRQDDAAAGARAPGLARRRRSARLPDLRGRHRRGVGVDRRALAAGEVVGAPTIFPAPAPRPGTVSPRRSSKLPNPGPASGRRWRRSPPPTTRPPRAVRPTRYSTAADRDGSGSCPALAGGAGRGSSPSCSRVSRRARADQFHHSHASVRGRS